MGDISSGLFALGGTVVGGLASWLGTFTDAKHRQQEAARVRLQQLAETRRLLYSTFVERSDVVMDAARDVFSYDDQSEVPAESKERYFQAWDQFVQARAAVEIVGPDVAGQAATALFQSVADVCNQIDTWYFKEKRWTPEDDTQRQSLLEERRKMRIQFVATAQAIVASGDGPD